MTTTPQFRRAAVLAATAGLALLASASPAQAADGPDLGSAQQVLQSGQVRDTVSRFLTVTRQQSAAPAAPAADGGTVGAPRSAAAPAGPPVFDLKNPVALYELAPDFVTGKARPTADGALRLSYLASRVAAADGHRAAVLLAPQDQKGSGWQLAGIRDGDAEVSLAEQGTAQARTFTEPQLNAWYRLTDKGQVEALNQEATSGLGGRHSVTLAAYQKLVNARYGDKLPGSAYDRKGLAGGYPGLDGTAAPVAGAAPAADASPVAAAAPAAAPADRTAWWAAAAAGALALGGAATALLRRRSAGTA
ncbi:hypothetical protein [Streptomyces sp. NRRL B-24484]|uniref:hypothetical protein n=1 Tax=Streptomyces sp. NRRL B-24484 TaxID=1463833 RepID=UPI0004BEF545|nr:hypothetical protein [Streptomyces sp. NRRL B-24484]